MKRSLSLIFQLHQSTHARHQNSSYVSLSHLAFKNVFLSFQHTPWRTPACTTTPRPPASPPGSGSTPATTSSPARTRPPSPASRRCSSAPTRSRRATRAPSSRSPTRAAACSPSAAATTRRLKGPPTPSRRPIIRRGSRRSACPVPRSTTP